MIRKLEQLSDPHYRHRTGLAGEQPIHHLQRLPCWGIHIDEEVPAVYDRGRKYLITVHESSVHVTTEELSAMASDVAARVGLAGGEVTEEWGVWWHGDSPAGIRLDEHYLRSREAALKLGPSRFGQYGIRAFTTIRRTNHRFPSGDWTTKWERVGDTVWQKESEQT